MSLYKKLGIGLGLATLLLAVWTLAPKAVSAAGITDSSYVPSSEAEIRNATFEFQDRSTIIGHFTRTLDSQAIDIEFTDSNPADNTYRYKVDKGLQPAWCDEKDNGGINFGEKGAGSIALSNPRSITQVKGYMDIDYSPSGVGGDCKNIGNNSTDNPLIYVTKADSLYTYLQWDNDKLVAGPGSVDNSDQQLGQSGTNDKIFQTGGCGLFVVLTDNHHGKLVQTAKNSSLTIIAPDAKQFVPILSKGQCRARSTTFSSVDNISIGSNWDKTFDISGTRGSPAPATTTGPGGTVGNDPCLKNSDSGLEWAMCPMLTKTAGGANFIDTTITGQLHYDINGNLPNGGGAYKAWSAIKDIASALIVIVMLVMIISQAIGNGPFEAYTIKKMLPKLVVAIILMQISWFFCKWAIGIANDLGDGLKQILLAPFSAGGGGNMGFFAILKHMDGSWAVGFGVTTIVVGVLAGIILAATFIPATLVLAFGLFLGAIMALCMLLFRNVLVVALTLFSPVAFLIWALPGQSMQRYWKFWSDNFTKLLMLFPLMVAIIYTGRIFAWIVAGANSTGSGHTPGFIDYMTIIVAYWGPYFVIFKAYGWGGSMLSAAGNAVQKGRQGIMKATTPAIRKQGEQLQKHIASKYNLADKPLRQKRGDYELTQGKIDQARNRLKEAREQGAPAKTIANLEKYLQKQEARADVQKSELRSLEGRPLGIKKMGRASLRIGAGKISPFTRGRVETLALAAQHQEEWAKLHTFEFQQDYQEQLDSGKSVPDAKEYLRKKHEAENYTPIKDASGRTIGKKVKDAYKARAFNNWTIDTKSGMELADEDWRQGAIKNADGKIVGFTSDPSITPDMAARGVRPAFDMGKTPEFISALHADGQRYAYIQGQVPELIPFRQAIGGGPKAEDYMDKAATIAKKEKYLAGGEDQSWNPKSIQAVDLKKAADNARRTGATVRATQLDAEATVLAAEADTVADKLVAEQREVWAGRLADDARLDKIYGNIEHKSDITNVRPEQLRAQAQLIQQFRDAGVESKFEKTAMKFYGDLAAERAAGIQESASALSRLKGGEKSAAPYVGAMMGDPDWVADTLNVPVRVEGVPRATALPKEGVELKRGAIAVPDGRGINLVAEEVARVMAENDTYADRAHRTTRPAIFTQVDSLISTAEATGNQEILLQVRSILDRAGNMARERAQRLTREATAANRADLPTYLQDVGSELNLHLQEIDNRRNRLPRPTVAPTVMTPGTIRIQHQQDYEANIPTTATIVPTPGTTNTQREAYKIRLLSDPSIAQVLAHGVAYEVTGRDAPGLSERQTQFELLEEMRNDIVASGDATQIATFNQIATRILQAFSQRITETAQAAAQRGHNAAEARGAAEARLAPEITKYDNLRI